MMSSSQFFLRKLTFPKKNFSLQCKPISNDSAIPSDVTYLGKNRLSYISLDCCKIHKVIQTLDPNKDNGRDGIFIRISKLCTK